MMGLDNAGKSTALYRMRTGQYCETIPTIGFNCEKVKGKINKSKDVIFTIWDVGGQDRVRPLWRTYARGAEGIMFVIDSADHNTLEEAKLELIQLFKHSDTNHLPIVILANKQDMPNAYDLNYLNYYLLNGLDSELAILKPGFKSNQMNHNNGNNNNIINDVNDKVKIVSACAITGDGLDESLDVLYEMILKNKQKPSKTKRIK